MSIVKNVSDSYKKSPVKFIGLSLFVLVGLIYSWLTTISLVIFILLWKKFKKEENGAKGTKKKCQHCKTEIDWEASRCPHCHGRIAVTTANTKIVLVAFAFVMVLGIVQISKLPPSSSSTSTATTSSTPSVQIGDTAFLRLPGVTGPTPVVCLGSTKEDFEEITKSMLAKDYIGLLEIPGAFCVSNGTKVQVIDSAFAVRRVRILEGVRKVDDDKVFMSGWTAMEWVSKN